MTRPIREIGTYCYDLDGKQLVVKFVVTIHPGYTNRACMGGPNSNCGCCWPLFAEVDPATIKDADTGKPVGLTADMLAELERDVDADPDRYLLTPWLEA